MALAVLYEMPESLRSPQMAVWSFAHQAHHRDIVRRVHETRNLTLVEYALDPIVVDDLDNWLRNHQLMHEQLDRALGIGDSDFTNLDWDNPASRASWITKHGNKHFRAGQILGIG